MRLTREQHLSTVIFTPSNSFFFFIGCPCIELLPYQPNFLKQLPNVSLMPQCIAFSKDKCEANGKIPPVILYKVCFPPLICFHVFGLVLLFLTLHYYQYTRPNRKSASSKHTLSGPQQTDSGLLTHYQPYS